MIDGACLLQMDPSRPSSACRTHRLFWTSWLSVGWDLRETSWWKVILRRGRPPRSWAVQNHFHPQWAVLLKSCKLNPAKGIASSLTVEFSRGFLFRHCSIGWRPGCADDSWRTSTATRRWSRDKSCHAHTDHELCWGTYTCKRRMSAMEFEEFSDLPRNRTLNGRLCAAGRAVLGIRRLALAIVPVVKVLERVFFLSRVPPRDAPVLYTFHDRIRLEVVVFCLKARERESIMLMHYGGRPVQGLLTLVRRDKSWIECGCAPE